MFRSVLKIRHPFIYLATGKTSSSWKVVRGPNKQASHSCLASSDVCSLQPGSIKSTDFFLCLQTSLKHCLRTHRASRGLGFSPKGALHPKNPQESFFNYSTNFQSIFFACPSLGMVRLSEHNPSQSAKASYFPSGPFPPKGKHKAPSACVDLTSPKLEGSPEQ